MPSLRGLSRLSRFGLAGHGLSDRRGRNSGRGGDTSEVTLYANPFGKMDYDEMSAA